MNKIKKKVDSKIIILTKIITTFRYLSVYEKNKQWELEIPSEISEEELWLNIEEQFVKQIK